MLRLQFVQVSKQGDIHTRVVHISWDAEFLLDLLSVDPEAKPMVREVGLDLLRQIRNEVDEGEKVD